MSGEGVVTEADWSTSIDAPAMLVFLQSDPASDRKLRLFAAACCRRTWRLLPDVSRRAVEVAERHADGLASPEDLQLAHAAARNAARDANNAAWVEANPDGDWEGIVDGVCRDASAAFAAGGFAAGHDRWYSSHAAHNCVLAVAHAASPRTVEQGIRAEAPGRTAARGAEFAAQSSLLRCVFGNPFRPAQFEAAWRTEAVVGLARGLYESQDFGPMPVLADALEDAGCGDEDILAHCRRPGPHTRGCWVVDAVLGKS
jgi:hypothetical protein